MHSDLRSVGHFLFSFGFLARNQHFLQAGLADSKPEMAGLVQKTPPFEILRLEIPVAVDTRDAKLAVGRELPKSNLDMRDRWDLNPRSSGLTAMSVGARCPILVVLAE